MTEVRKKCPPTCQCMCHEFGVTAEHGDHPVCPTKLGLPLVDVEWEYSYGNFKRKKPKMTNQTQPIPPVQSAEPLSDASAMTCLDHAIRKAAQKAADNPETFFLDSLGRSLKKLIKRNEKLGVMNDWPRFVSVLVGQLREQGIVLAVPTDPGDAEDADPAQAARETVRDEVHEKPAAEPEIRVSRDVLKMLVVVEGKTVHGMRFVLDDDLPNGSIVPN